MKKNQNQKERKNSALKNTCLAYGEMFKRYPASPFILLLHIIARVLTPITYTVIPAVAIKGITSGDLRFFLTSIALVLLAVFVVNMISGYTTGYLQNYRIYTRLGHFSINFFKKTLKTDYMNLEPEPKRRIMDKAVQAVTSNYTGVENLMNQAMEMVILIFGMFTYGSAVFILDWRIMAITLAMFIADTLCREWAIRYSDKHREERSVLYRKINYLRGSIKDVNAGKDIRIYGLSGWFAARFNSLLKGVEKNQRGISLHWFFPTIADCLFMLPRDILAYSLLISKVLAGQMDVATFTLYLGLVSGFANWIYGMSNTFHDIRKASHEFNDYNDFIDLKERSDQGGLPPFHDQRGQPPLQTEAFKGAPEIEFKDVSFNYEGSDKKIFDKLSFKIRAGEKIALVGNNGAGKTTIVKLLCGLYAPTSGQVLVNGQPLWDSSMSVKKYMESISVLFQDTEPFALSLAMNIACCDQNDLDRQRVKDCIKKAGLKETVEGLIHKEDTYITQQLDDDGVQLSGGQVQKLLLARAIYKNGPFLILDEPTSALDPLAESKIYEEYNNLALNKTAVFISHRLASTKFCDRILFLDQGRIIEEGSHAQLMAKGGKYREIFDIQSHYYSKKSEEIKNEK
ncbi:MAG: ABC transporter ATP-binding protein/permease [Treponema sp.]|nr:ABC transporter ATP-binding protein/permease [Treponema sp.]